MADDASRIVLVTGARKGLGRFLAERLLGDGWKVVGCSRSPSDLTHPAYRHVCADVSDEAGVRLTMAEVRAFGGRLQAVVNNAGIAAMNHALLTPAETFSRILAVNTLGTFLVSREAAKLMQRLHYGRIINLSSVAVPLALAGEAAYAASKGAVETMTRVLAQELGHSGITVNAIGPGPIDTDLIRSVPEAKLTAITRRQAIPRMGTPDDVWNVVRFYLSPDSSFVTGQVLYLGGVP